jgi:hypothetical protein
VTAKQIVPARPALFVLGLALCAVAACRDAAPDAAAAPRAADTVRVTVRDTLVTLARGTARSTISLGESINSAGGFASTLLDRRWGGDGRFYLLVETTGLSRPHAPHGLCGAGEEMDITWLAVDSAMQLRKRETVLVESCLQNRVPVSASAKRTGEPWSTSFHIPGDSIRTASYDRRHPERGLRVTTEPDTTAL